MTTAAPRIRPALLEALARHDDPGIPIAETCRRVGAEAHQGPLDAGLCGCLLVTRKPVGRAQVGRGERDLDRAVGAIAAGLALGRLEIGGPLGVRAAPNAGTGATGGLARILAVAESYEAMTAGRGCERVTPLRALELVKAGAGSEFDPVLVEALARAVVEGSLEPGLPSTALPAVAGATVRIAVPA